MRSIYKKKTKCITSNVIETPPHARIRICATGWDDLPLRCVYTHLLIFLPPLFIFSKNWKNNPHQPRIFSLKNIDTAKKSTVFDRSRWDLFKKYIFFAFQFFKQMQHAKNFFVKNYTKITKKSQENYKKMSQNLKNLGVFEGWFSGSSIFSLRLAAGKRVP